MRNASRRKALYQWCPTCSHIKLHTIQQAIIFVCFFCSRVRAHSSGAVQLYIAFKPVEVSLNRRQSAYYFDKLPPPTGYGWHRYEFQMVN